MTTDEALHLFNNEVMFSYLGTACRVVTVTSGDFRETIVFVAGAPMLYRVFAGLLMSKLYDFDLDIEDMELKVGVQELWDRVKLPSNVATGAVSIHPLRFGRDLIERVLADQVRRNDNAKDNLIAFIDDIEDQYAASLMNPIEIEGDIQVLFRPEPKTEGFLESARNRYFESLSQKS